MPPNFRWRANKKELIGNRNSIRRKSFRTDYHSYIEGFSDDVKRERFEEIGTKVFSLFSFTTVEMFLLRPSVFPDIFSNRL